MPDPNTDPTAAEKAANNLARAEEHQRLSAAIQGASLCVGDVDAVFAINSWRIVISLARDAWGNGRPDYQNFCRWHAFRDAADAIARAAIGEAAR